MDLYKQINSVATLDDYIELTQDVDNRHKHVKITFNMSTILCLKNIRSLEIEYFNKCDGNGAAFKLFERMLSSPASKTWGLLGSAVIDLMQYWLDAVRKHLISHHIHWWIFLRQILLFIKELRQKAPSISSLLVEELSESMLDLATSGKPDVYQRYEILHNFNLFCAESSREIRLALRTQFEPYFIRLATIMATCGHLPSQFAALEALLRWLQPRQDPGTRREAANKWFLPHLYPKAVVNLFLNRSWMNFFQDARDFLNCHNEANDLITSVICRKLAVGKVVIISGEERRQSWLDINSGSHSITVVLEPQLLEALGAGNVASCETLTVEKDNTKLVKLYRESKEVTLSIATHSAPCVVPSRAQLFARPGDVTVVLSSRSNMPRIHQALRTVFEDKYQALLDVENMELSPEDVRRKNCMDENPRFSHAKPATKQHRKPRTGSVAWSKRFANLESPSTASTGSLAQLHDRLANLPYYEFTKEPVSVCAQPELSIVNELNESQISNSLGSNSTLKLRRCSVRLFRAHAADTKSKSDTETARGKILDDIQEQNVEQRRNKGSQSDKYVQKTKIVEGNISTLFAATIESADNSVISATIERIPKDKEITTDNLIELLLQEALQSKSNEEKVRESDSGINTENGKSQEQIIQDSETIEDTQYTGKITSTKNPSGLRNIKVKTPNNKTVSKSTSDESNTEAIIETRNIKVKTPTNKIVSKSTSDESNTEAILETRNIKVKIPNNKIVSKSISDESNTEAILETRNIKVKTPNNKIVSKFTSDESNTEAIIKTPLSFVSVRKRIQRQKSAKNKETEKSDEALFNNNEVEEFFSQHFAENKMGDVIISPTLAKKINESSSSSSDQFLMKDIDDSFDIRNEKFPDLDIVECLNDIVDKVCSDFEKCARYLDKNGADTKILNMAELSNTKQNIPIEEKCTDDAKVKENSKPLKNLKSKEKQTLKLKFTSKKQKAKPKTKGKLKLEPVAKMSTIVEDNNESEANKTALSVTKKISTDDQINEHKVKTPVAVRVSIDSTPPARRKRKLYSPKDDEIQFNITNNEGSSNNPDIMPSDYEDNIALADLKTDKVITAKPSTSCYKEIEQERKKYKRIRARKSKNVESPPSPKTKRLDAVFEKLKDSIEVHENEKIIMVDKKSDKDVAIFNFTSDSEDEDFKQKKNEIQKRTSTTTIGSGTSIMSTRRGRVKEKPKYKEDKKDSAKKSAKSAKRKRVPRRKASEAKTPNSPDLEVDRPIDLVDEKMREALPEELNRSFVAAIVDNNEKEPGPLIKPPELEIISEANANIDVEDCKEKVTPKQKITKKKYNKDLTKDEIPTKAIKKCTKTGKNIAKKREKDTKLTEFPKDDDGTISPLPGLVIETENGRNGVEDSITTNVVRKLQKIYKEGPDALNDTTTTQNMLSETEKPNSSPHMNITEEMCKIFEDDRPSNSKKNKTPKTSDLDNKVNSDVVITDDTINSDQMSSKNNKRSRLRLKRKNQPDFTASTTSPKECNTANIKSKNQQLTESQKSKTKSIKSHIDEINYDEIICIDTEIVTQPKIRKCRSISKEIEIINIIADSDENSERSIATDGITGHGDINELPPSPKLLRENLSPREIQDMDPMIREYYIELSNKVNNSKESSVSRKNIHSDEKLKTKAMQRVEEGSDSEPEQRSKKGYNFERRKYAIEKMLPSQRDTESENSSQTSKKTPTVSITRLSSKEIAIWLPSAETMSQSSFKSAQKNEDTLKRIAKKIISKETTVESSFETGEKNAETTKVVRNRKSQISPIKLDAFMPKRKIVRKDISSCKDETKDKQDVAIVSKLDSIAKKYFLRSAQESSPISREPSENSTPRTVRKSQSPVSKAIDVMRRKLDEDFTVELDSIAKKYFKRPAHESSPISRQPSDNSTPRTVPESNSPVSKVIEVKKRRIDKQFRVETIDTSESRQSSNVEDWLKNILNTPKVDNSDASRDALQNLMEKLDTTLVEINQNTTKDFIGLFVEAQKQLTAMKEAQRRQRRDAAAAILSCVTQLLDRTFAEMDQQAEERDGRFMSWLRSGAADVLRRDCARKRALLALLREDAQAVHDHMASQ